jgi:O-antigen biosynthesis protein
MLRRETLNRMGLLSERLFLGGEDLELSWRLRTQGLSLVVARDVFVHHDHGVSFRSLPDDHKEALLARSNDALRLILEQAYGDRVPSSAELWGSDIFAHVIG